MYLASVGERRRRRQRHRRRRRRRRRRRALRRRRRRRRRGRGRRRRRRRGRLPPRPRAASSPRRLVRETVRQEGAAEALAPRRVETRRAAPRRARARRQRQNRRAAGTRASGERGRYAAEKASSRGKTTASEKTSRGKPTRGKGKGKGKGTTRDDAGGAGPTTNDETSGAAFVSVGGSEEDASDESQYCAALRGLAFDLRSGRRTRSTGNPFATSPPGRTSPASRARWRAWAPPYRSRPPPRRSFAWTSGARCCGPRSSRVARRARARRTTRRARRPDFFFPSQRPHAPPKRSFEPLEGARAVQPEPVQGREGVPEPSGTWSGAKGETWDPAVSTTLQVIVSVQSLILWPRPYFNERGPRNPPAPRRAIGGARSTTTSSPSTPCGTRCSRLKKPPDCSRRWSGNTSGAREEGSPGTVKDAWLKAKTSAESRRPSEGPPPS